MKKKKNSQNKRNLIQLMATALTDGYILGFAQGKIFKGNTKAICVPGLNCYSCPGALGACPIGALQAVIGGKNKNFSYYVVGILILFGVLFGRFICGFLCPFGLIQDLLYKIPTKKFKIPPKIDKPLRMLKYVLLVVFVIGMPLFLTNAFGNSLPYFCKLICPAGTLEGGIPLTLMNEGLRSQLGWLFNWKMFILISVILLSVFTYRPFCKYMCPLGAIYGLFNKYSLYQMNVDKNACINCKACIKACPMEVDVLKNINSPECIRCGRCKDACPCDAISAGFFIKQPKTKYDIE